MARDRDGFRGALTRVMSQAPPPSGGGGRFRLAASGIGVAVAAIVVAATGFGSYFTVPQDSVALVQRFGKLVRTVEPGLQWKIPLGVEAARIVPVERVLKQEFGFHTVAPDVRTEYGVDDADATVSAMLTGDLNIADVEWIVQYKIKDPVAYTFHVRNLDETLRSLSESVMRRVVGDRSVTEVLTVGRAEIALEAEKELQTLLDVYGTGVQIVTVQLQDVRPPKPVEPSFNEVNEAKQEQERTINEAWSDYNKAIPAAQGGASRTIAEAEGYAIDRVNRARGDAARFLPVVEEYKKAPEVTRRRLYLETMAQVMPALGRLVVLDENARALPILGLNGEVVGTTLASQPPVAEEVAP